MAADGEVVLPALSGAERAEAAAQFAAIAKRLTSLARIFDPHVKLTEPRGKKADPDAPPKPKRELTAYNKFIMDNLSDYKKEVRAPGARNPERLRGARCEA